MSIVVKIKKRADYKIANYNRMF